MSGPGADGGECVRAGSDQNRSPEHEDLEPPGEQRGEERAKTLVFLGPFAFEVIIRETTKGEHRQEVKEG